MEKFSEQPTLTRYEEIKTAIARSAEEIEEEFSRTANSWLACFGNRISIIETYLDNQKVAAEIGEEKYLQANARLEDLKQRLFDLKEQYPDKDTIPPTIIKQELLTKLNILE
jgi:RNA binding exosome subunit